MGKVAAADKKKNASIAMLDCMKMIYFFLKIVK